MHPLPDYSERSGFLSPQVFKQYANTIIQNPKTKSSSLQNYNVVQIILSRLKMVNTVMTNSAMKPKMPKNHA
jgi:hypothetical protein